MNVLLVYPRFPKTFWSFDGVLEMVGRKVLLPPLGLITVAALLPASWSLRLVDGNIREVSEADWAWADLAIFSAMLVQKRDLARQIEMARAHDLPVAVGGPFATSTPGAPELAAADFLILDEGEITVPAFVAALARGETRGRFGAGGERPDVSLSPLPRFDLLELEAYDMMAVQFSRGCPFQCEFCDIIVLYGRKPRTKSPDQLLAELEALYALGWRRDVFLVDDNFIGNKRNVKCLLPRLLAWQRQKGFPFSFTTEASVDLAADDALMTQMVACGFRRVFLGIETPDEASLVAVHKLQNTRSSLEQAVEAITAKGLQVMAGFILGFDGEQAGAGRRIVDFVTRTSIPVAMLGVLQALPNTALWHRLEREGRLLHGDGRFDEGVQTNLVNFRPTRPMPEIAAEFLEAFTQLYDPRTYLDRVYAYVGKLGATRPGRTAGKGKGLRRHLGQVKALRGVLVLFWRQGLVRPSRWRFWHHLLAVAIRRPWLLDQYLWMLMLNEHFLGYRSLVVDQVTAQLQKPEALQQPNPSALVAPQERPAAELAGR
ncbi:B12-binding domain-containing radical SAM protein [Synechococcus sp. CCY 9618]|uniref:B12-binding domain-containing radical SAM protein n=1 Tax=Synechococcus sp. CCY 9618 TaxID=2815602 RepID=UPI001C2415C4|nr:B12-binding domain-containing radical SAM protein [Synechococcus sp. CCY 9618]